VSTIAINLLAHRAMRREQRRRSFIGLLVLSAILAAGVVIVGGLGYQVQIEQQNQRNEFIAQENKQLDKQISEVTELKREIDALRARQSAVEGLQSDRNQPVHLLDELVKFTPEGVYLRTVMQDSAKVVITGVGQSNERISEYLRNLSTSSVWLKKPNLIEIKAGQQMGRGSKTYDFSMDLLIVRPGQEADALGLKSGRPSVDRKKK
jgi:type IV pilus assembly protein PilN